MATISKLPQNATVNPEQAFASPQDLVNQAGLTRGQKVSALRRWRYSVEQRLAATNEGMSPEGTGNHDMALLEQIDAALLAIEDTPNASLPIPPGSPP